MADSDEARRLEPALPDSIHGALLAPSHGYVAVSSLTEALVWARCDTAPSSRPGGTSGDISASTERARGDGRRRRDVDGAARGHRVGQLVGPTRAARSAARSVRPVRGQLLRLAWKGQPLSHVIWGKDCYIVPWRDGTVLVGATVEEVGFDERTTAAGVRDLLDAVCELLPEAWGATFLEARAGLRPATPDGCRSSARRRGRRRGLRDRPLPQRRPAGAVDAAIVADLILTGGAIRR